MSPTVPSPGACKCSTIRRVTVGAGNVYISDPLGETTLSTHCRANENGLTVARRVATSPASRSTLHRYAIRRNRPAESRRNGQRPRRTSSQTRRSRLRTRNTRIVSGGTKENPTRPSTRWERERVKNQRTPPPSRSPNNMQTQRPTNEIQT